MSKHIGDMFLEKGLPSNVEAERAILGAILLDPQAVADQAQELIKREHFSLDSNRRIFDAMIHVWNTTRHLDFIPLADELRKRDEFEQVGGNTYIASLIDGVPRTDTIEHYVKIVIDKADKRTLIHAFNNLVAACLDDEELDDIRNRAEQVVFNVGRRHDKHEAEQVGPIGTRVVEGLEKMSGNSIEFLGVPSGLTDLDMITLGFQRQTNYIIAARPSHGKTSLALGAAVHAALDNFNVLFFSCEMSAERLAFRILAMLTRIDSHRLRRAMLTRDEWARVADALRLMYSMKLYIDDTPSLSVPQMRSKARRKKAELQARGEDLDEIFVDYLQLMTPTKVTGNENQDIKSISAGLVEVSHELNLPVIALSQLSRMCEQRSNKRPMLSDLRDSGAIEADADCVVFVYNDSIYGVTEENCGIVELIVSKHRDGPTGSAQVAFMKEYTRFENLWKDAA